MLEVAVIGAGASGLVASRHLLGHGLRPSIFEAAKTLGGAWQAAHDDNNLANAKMWKGMTMNLSKYTCRFSDWPWPEQTPVFPTVSDMHQYLESYAHHFLDPTCFHYQCQVTNIASLSDNNGSRYRVEWTDLASQTQHAKDFEGVVVASGFFSKPIFPSGMDPTNNDKLLHSSVYYDHQDFADQSVAVIGSSFSALEIAVDVHQSAKRVIHILPSIPWVVPRYVPRDDGVVLPIDLALYRRTKDAPQQPEVTHLTPAMARQRHALLHTMVGSRQAQSPLGIPTNWDEPPKVAISDYYLELVIQGSIDVVRGRLEGIDNDKGLQVQGLEGQSMVLPDVDKVICCTGYTSHLDAFLDNSILRAIEYDAHDSFHPMTMCWDTLHPSLPNLFLCGMYRGPYMGIMEQQARLAAGILSKNINLQDHDLQDALEVSRQIRTQDPRPQFPHFDYLGFLDTLTAPLHANYPKLNAQKGDMVSPAFYQDDEALAQKVQSELDVMVEKGQDGSRIPALVLSAMIGSWQFHRNIVHHSENRHEEVHGTVRFSSPALDYVLYREDGTYEYAPGKVLNVFREYEYLMAHDTLEIYFVEQGARAHLFLGLRFTHQNERGYWEATSDHLCIKDLYKANFQVKLDGLAATEIIMTYRVKGPTKDYESTTRLLPQL